jgi:hypothetical protein
MQTDRVYTNRYSTYQVEQFDQNDLFYFSVYILDNIDPCQVIENPHRKGNTLDLTTTNIPN